MWTANDTDQSKLMVHLNGVVHGEREIGDLLLRELVRAPVCISMRCVGGCQQQTLGPAQLREWACISDC